MTTPYYIKISPTAAEHIKALSLKHRKLIFKLIEALAVNPRPPDVKKIEGMTGLYSESVNNLRLVYKVEEQEILLLLVKS
jgi:mRNA interferase RelE/StbE